MESVEAYDTLLGLAQGKLLELESQQLIDGSLPDARQGTFPDPYQSYQWTLSVTRRPDPVDAEGKPLMSDVLIKIQQADHPGMVQLSAIWPANWFPD